MTAAHHTAPSGHHDPEGEAPWAMQLVAHVPKDTAIAHQDLCAAAAAAVVSFLDAAADEPAWAAAVDRWHDGRIRKVVRRARGARWAALDDLAGVTADCAAAQVRAFVPGPVDQVDPRLAKLQVRGLDLDARDAVPAPAGQHLRVTVNPHVTLSTGKAAAQVAHAAHVAYLEHPAQRPSWRAAGFAVDVRSVPGLRWDAVVAAAPVRIVDAGFTEIPANTMTCVARWT